MEVPRSNPEPEPQYYDFFGSCMFFFRHITTLLQELDQWSRFAEIATKHRTPTTEIHPFIFVGDKLIIEEPVDISKS